MSNGAVHRLQHHGTHVVYCHDVPVECVDQLLEGTYACAIGMVSSTTRAFQLMHLFVPAEQRGRGIATALLQEIVQLCQDLGMYVVEVDDMSDRARQPHNVYVKAGFRYRNSWGPEMFAFVRAQRREHLRSLHMV